MTDSEKNYNSLVSIIKIEPEKFQPIENFASSSDDFLKRQAKIFLEPVVFLERIAGCKKESGFDGDSISELFKKGNAGKASFEPHICCLCEKVFGDRSALRKHLKNVHGKAPKMFCDLCSKVFRLKNQLALHMKSHFENVFACDVCDFKTVHKYNLQKHKKIHLKPEKCKICNKQVASLRDHLGNHQKEECPVCSKMISKRRMIEHMKRAHDDKKYKCTECESKFSSCEEWRRHKLEQHYKGKLHRCHCGSVYKSKSVFYRHQMCHKSEETTCKICKRNFKHSISFKKHWKKSHFKTHGSLVSSKVVKNVVCDKNEQTSESRQSFKNHFQDQDLNAGNSQSCSQQQHPDTKCEVCRNVLSYLPEHLRDLVEVKCKTCGKTCANDLLEEMRPKMTVLSS